MEFGFHTAFRTHTGMQILLCVHTHALAVGAFLLSLCLVKSSLVWEEKRTGCRPGGVNWLSALRSSPLELYSPLKALCGSWRVKQHKPGPGLVSHSPLITAPLFALPLSGSWHLFMTSHWAQVEVFFFLLFLCTTCTDSGTAVHHFLSNPKGAIPHWGNVLAGICTCLKDDLRMSCCILPPNVTVFICSFTCNYLFVLKKQTYIARSRTGHRTQPSQHSHYKTAMSERKRSLSRYNLLCLLLLSHGSGTDLTFFPP